MECGIEKMMKFTLPLIPCCDVCEKEDFFGVFVCDLGSEDESECTVYEWCKECFDEYSSFMEGSPGMKMIFLSEFF